mmetsp:Transcript_102803/g.221904  ORF Transcript_102803/g.221904 Transcript_102803/m.221904 type:complete len:119 (-) Transcript_102803:133-489(-)
MSNVYNSAFERVQENAGSVYLFFSMRYSSKFQGIARMTSKVDAIGVFSLKWLVFNEVPNSYFKQIMVQNPDDNLGSNYSKDISSCLDGQIIDFNAAQQFWQKYVHRTKLSTKNRSSEF